LAYALIAAAENKLDFSLPNHQFDGYAPVCTLTIGDAAGPRITRPKWLPFIAPLRQSLY
jgi:hypothetical protein